MCMSPRRRINGTWNAHIIIIVVVFVIVIDLIMGERVWIVMQGG